MKEVVTNIPEGIRSVGKPRKRWLGNAGNNLKNMGVRAGREKKKLGIRRQEIDPEGDHGPARTVQPVDKLGREARSFLACWTADTMTELGNVFVG